MKGIIGAILVVTVFLSACGNTSTDPNSSSSKKENKNDKAGTKNSSKKEDENESKPQVLNDILLETEGGVEVNQASFLMRMVM